MRQDSDGVKFESKGMREREKDERWAKKIRM